VAVFERHYRPYDGELTTPRWRFLVLPRYAFGQVFQSKLFIAFLVACFLTPLFLALWIYIPHNSTFVKTFEAMLGEQININFKASYYPRAFMAPQSFLAFLLSLMVGPTLIAADLKNNAMPLYLSRPFDRKDYVLGKASVLVLLLSAITWVPGLLLFFLQSYIEGFAWFQQNLRTGVAIVVSSWVWIIFLSVVSLAISAYMKWKPVAQAAYFGLFLFSGVFTAVLVLFLKTEWAHLFNISASLLLIWGGLFGVELGPDLPVWSAWVALSTFCGLCLVLLMRKIRAYEVVGS